MKEGVREFGESCGRSQNLSTADFDVGRGRLDCAGEIRTIVRAVPMLAEARDRARNCGSYLTHD